KNFPRGNKALSRVGGEERHCSGRLQECEAAIRNCMQLPSSVRTPVPSQSIVPLHRQTRHIY
ncbi:transcriptional elongation factor FACT80, partial [Toxoplasma gondii CAST]